MRPAAAGGYREGSTASTVFDHALADDLVDCGLDERGGEGLTTTAAFPVVGDPGGVRAHVAAELAHRRERSGRRDRGKAACPATRANPVDTTTTVDRRVAWNVVIAEGDRGRGFGA